MQPPEILDRDTTPDGAPVVLSRHAGNYKISVDGLELMSTYVRGSEVTMVELALEALAPRPARRVLVGGLGMGYTLRGVLDTVGPTAEVVVVELLPCVMRWNRGPLAELAGRPLDDPRVAVVESDVWGVLAREATFDVILLDVDNGPSAFTLEANGRLYGDEGIARCRRALGEGGVLCLWSSYPDAAYERRLRRAGLAARSVGLRARQNGKGPRNTIFLAVRGTVDARKPRVRRR